MVLLHLVFPAAVGGLERVVEALTTGLSHRGHRVAVAGIVLQGHEEPALLVALRNAGVDVHLIRVRGRGYLHERKEIHRLCKSLGPHVVHTHGYRPDVVDAGVARALGIPVISTVHGFTGGDWRNRLYERLDRRALRRFDAVVAVSHGVAERLLDGGVSRARVHVIPNAWSRGEVALPRDAARRELGLDDGEYRVGWVGRFSAEKGPDVLVRAMALLRDLPLTATMLGVGPELDRVRTEVGRLGIADAVLLPGAVPDAARLMSAFDVFVLSSRTEGTPIALFEAMAAGVPVVATRVGGVPEVVGEEGMLVPSDDAQALAAAIRAVLDDTAAAAARAARARHRLATEYAPGPWLERHEKLYEHVSRA